LENLFNLDCAEEIKGRLAHLTLEHSRRWGKMNAAEMLAHCSKGLQMAAGEIRPPRVTIGRFLGPIVKPIALREGVPMRKNSPTAQVFIIVDAVDFETERKRLIAQIDRFVAAGPAACTSHPHPFFGRLSPDEWSVLMWKHLDHHLRQFGV